MIASQIENASRDMIAIGTAIVEQIDKIAAMKDYWYSLANFPDIANEFDCWNGCTKAEVIALQGQLIALHDLFVASGLSVYTVFNKVR